MLVEYLSLVSHLFCLAIYLFLYMSFYSTTSASHTHKQYIKHHMRSPASALPRIISVDEVDMQTANVNAPITESVAFLILFLAVRPYTPTGKPHDFKERILLYIHVTPM